MTQKLFLTSALAMGVIAPAMAEPERVATFPNAANNEFMQENKVYTNAATSTNMDGVYSGTVNAVAEYDIIDYIVNAGQYLPADSETVITCPAGSYCPGIDGNVQYNQTTPQGIQTCPTGYASSAAGASSDTECYRQCSGNVTIEHATGVTGNDYYGNGTDTCEPTGCVAGWHLKQGQTLYDKFHEYNPDDSSVFPGVHKEGRIEPNGVFQEFDGVGGNEEFYGITEPKTYSIYYENVGFVRTTGRCSTTSGTITTNLEGNPGQADAVHCWCTITGYRETGSTIWKNIETLWYYMNQGEYSWGSTSEQNRLGKTHAELCNESCYAECGNPVSWINLLTTIQLTNSSCEANTITINWNGTTQEAINANNAGTATYGEDVRTPVSATPVKGKTFRGWRFSKPEQTDLPE